jgi:hypothetical protein
MARCAQPQVLAKGQPGVRLELAVEFLANQRHLPRVTIRRAARCWRGPHGETTGVNSLDTAGSACRFRSTNECTKVRIKIPGPLHPEWSSGGLVLQDSRILDLRDWNPTAAGAADTTSLVYGYRRLKVMKRTENAGKNLFRIDVLGDQFQDPGTVLGDKQRRWPATWNFDRVPPGEYVDLIYEHVSPAVFLHREDGGSSVAIHMVVDTAEVTRWFLMPQGKEYKNYRILRYPTGKPETVEPVGGRIPGRRLHDPRLQIALRKARLYLRSHMVLQISVDPHGL